MLMVTKHVKVVIYHEGISFITLHDPSLTSFMKSRKKSSILYLHLHKTNGHQTLQGANFLWGASTHKVT